MRFLALVVILIGILAGCRPENNVPGSSEQREAQVAVQTSPMERAESLYPIPSPSEFATRRSLVKWGERMDVVDRPFYVYVFNDTIPEPLFYFVFESRPVTTCSFLTTPEQIQYRRSGDDYVSNVVQAPALDGVYYGAGGQCDQQFGFDAATDAMLEFTGWKLVSSDQPLPFEAKAIRVAVELPEAP